MAAANQSWRIAGPIITELCTPNLSAKFRLRRAMEVVDRLAKTGGRREEASRSRMFGDRPAGAQADELCFAQSLSPDRHPGEFAGRISGVNLPRRTNANRPTKSTKQTMHPF
jgi:hypothetical protein